MILEKEAGQKLRTPLASMALGYPLMSSSDWAGSSPIKAIIRPESTKNTFQRSWVAGTLDKDQWLQVSFLAPKQVVGFATQGRANAS